MTYDNEPEFKTAAAEYEYYETKKINESFNKVIVGLIEPTIGQVVGLIMRDLKGKANPAYVNEIVTKNLSE
jgi:Asp-tRNA(Asn)/Glu-tRNA(Gln) amidotransferase B subunit